MPAQPKDNDRPVALFHGEETLLVRRRARSVFDAWCGDSGGMDHEIIDGTAGNSDEAMRSIAKLREALQTLPFFGGSKVVWWQGCTFLGDDRTSGSAAVTQALSELGPELAGFRWDGVRLVISAGKVDKRRVFYKRLESIAWVQEQETLSAEMKDWAQRAEDYVVEWLKPRAKQIEPEALAALVAGVGPSLSLLESETEKLATHVGNRPVIGADDVQRISVRNKQARAFALADALADRDVPRMLKALDEELWVMQGDRDRSEIGLLYGLVSKVRSMLLAKELIREKLVGIDADYNRFKAQVAKVPADRFPDDRRYNPAAINTYVLFRAAAQSRRWSEAELVDALDQLLECNLRLISGSQPAGTALQRALLEVAPARPGRS